MGEAAVGGPTTRGKVGAMGTPLRRWSVLLLALVAVLVVATVVGLLWGDFVDPEARAAYERMHARDGVVVEDRDARVLVAVREPAGTRTIEVVDACCTEHVVGTPIRIRVMEDESWPGVIEGEPPSAYASAVAPRWKVGLSVVTGLTMIVCGAAILFVGPRVLQLVSEQRRTARRRSSGDLDAQESAT